MEFSYDKTSKKYLLGSTEYSEAEFIQYIKSGMLRTTLENSKKSDFDVVEKDKLSSPKATKPAESYEQIVFYGVPGSGKSYKIDNEKTVGASEYQKQKVVFHPDYTNADFIGQIIPKMKEIGEGGK